MKINFQIFLCLSLSFLGWLPAENKIEAFSLSNGGFENGVANWFWEQYKGLPEPGHLSKEGAATGSFCYQLGLAGGQGSRFINTGSVRVLGSCPYELRLSLACEEVPEEGVVVRILQYGNEKGDGVSPQGWVAIPGAWTGDLVKTGGTTGWKEWVVPIPAKQIKPSTQRLSLFIFHKEIGMGTVRIDGVSLAPFASAVTEEMVEGAKTAKPETGKAPVENGTLPPVPPGNLIPGDSSFETGVGDWAPGARVLGGTHGASAYFAPPSVTNWKGPNWYAVVRKGTNYTLSVDAKSSEGVSLLIDIWNLEYQILKRQRVEVTPAWKRHQISLPAQAGDHSIYLAFTKETPGGVTLDAFQFEAGPAGTYRSRDALLAGAELLDREAGSVFLPGPSPLRVGLRLFNEAHEGSSFQVRATTADFGGRVCASAMTNLQVSKGGGLEVALPMTANREPGYYLCTLEVGDGQGKLVLKQEIPAVVVGPPVKMATAADSFFGIQGHGVAPEAVARIGAKWYRAFRAWRWLESQSGRLTLSPSQWQPWKNSGLSLMETVQFTLMPDWARGADGKVKDPALVGNYARGIAAQLGENAQYFEIENEPDLVVPSSAKLSTEAGAAYYSEVLRESARAIKAQNPKALVLGSGVSGGDFDTWAFSSEVFRHARPDFDIWAFHPYAPTRNLGPKGLSMSPEDNRLREKLLDAEAKVKAWGGAQKIWVGELGWAFDVKEPVSSPYARQHGEMLARAFILAKSVGAVEHLFWFAIKGVLEGGYEYGIWRDERTPLPAVAAYSACARALDGARPHKAIYESEVRAYVFACPDGSGVAALWKHRGAPTELRLAENTRGVRLVDMVGSALPVTLGSGGLAIPLGSAPVYFRVDGMGAAALTRVIEEGKLAMDPVALNAVLGESTLLRGTVKNNLPRPVTGTLRLECPPGLLTPTNTRSVVLPASGVMAFSFPLSGSPLSSQGLLALVMAGPEGETRANISVAAQTCPWLSPNWALPTTPWKGALHFSLADRSFIQPPDAAVIWKTPQNLGVEADVAWDDSFFYIAAQVADDIFFQEKNGRGLFAGDSLQLAFDTRCDGAPSLKSYDGNDHEFGLALCPQGPTFVRYYGGENPKVPEAVVGVKLSVEQKGTVTYYQVAIPWAALAPLYPTPGRRFGFNFIVNDNDGHGRKYWMGLTPGIGEMKYPHLFEKFVLAPKGPF